MTGGTLETSYISVLAQYLLKSLQGFSSKGIPVYAISIQVSLRSLFVLSALP